MRNKILFPDLTQNKLLALLGFTTLMLLPHASLMMLVFVHELGHLFGYVAGIGIPLGMEVYGGSGYAIGIAVIGPFGPAGAFAFPFAVAIIMLVKFRGYGAVAFIAGVSSGVAMILDYLPFASTGDFASLNRVGGVAPWVILTTMAMVAEFFLLQWYLAKRKAKARAAKRPTRVPLSAPARKAPARTPSSTRLPLPRT